MKKKFTLILLLCLGMNAYAQRYSEKFSDVNYAGDGQPYHNLDIYLPESPKEQNPVVIHIYGSAFLSNNGKNTADLGTVVASLLDAGFAVVTPNHRSSSDAIYPAQIHDIKAVIRFIKGNSSTYKLDTNFVGMSGFSSGGQLASLAGTTRNVKTYTVGSVTMDLEGDLGEFDSFSSYVHAVCDWSAPTNLLVMDSCGSSLDNNAANSPAGLLVGGAIQQNKDKTRLTNPITFIDPTDPPFLLVHGTADNIVPICQSQFFDQALRAKNVSSELLIAQGGGHSVSTQYVPDMVEFFKAQLAITSTFTSENENNLSVFVDEMNEKLFIKNLPGNVSANYEITGMSGMQIKSGLFQEEGVSISSLKNGIYLVKVIFGNDKVSVLKFVKSE